MASSFTLRYNSNVIPYEIVTLADGTTTIKSIHSIIDKGIGGSNEKVIGDTSTFIKYKAYTTTITGVAFTDSTILNTTGSLNFLAVKIVSAASSSTPQVEISIDGTNYDIVLYGIGDMCVVPINPTDMANIKIKSSGATTLANIEIMVAEEA